MAIPEPSGWVTEYKVSCLPPDDVNARYYTLTVTRYEFNKWYVHDNHMVLGADGQKTEFVATLPLLTIARRNAVLFTCDGAFDIAMAAAPHLTANGKTVADALSDSDTPEETL